jgi:predicted RNA-binding protein with TRAM domain
MLHRIGAALGVLLALAYATPEAWARKIGPEVRINTYTPGSQDTPSVAGLSNSGYVVTWSSEGQDGSESGIYAQRYRVGGGRDGGEFQVNTTTAGRQLFPSVASLTDGGFVVTWFSFGQDDEGYSRDICGQRYDAAGARVGSEFQVNTMTAVHQGNSVAGLSNGGFVVTWDTFDVGPVWRAYGQLYGADGGKVGAEFQIAAPSGRLPAAVSVASLSNGGFVTTWESDRPGSRYSSIYGQRYSAAGAKVGAEFRANSRYSKDARGAVAAGLSNGGFVVIWSFWRSVFAQRYSPEGLREGENFEVNTGRNAARSSAARLADGGFIVIWDSARDQLGSGFDVYGQRFSATGARIDGEFEVNTTRLGLQGDPAVAALRNGGFVVTWHGTGTGDRVGIYGQRFYP